MRPLVWRNLSGWHVTNATAGIMAFVWKLSQVITGRKNGIVQVVLSCIDNTELTLWLIILLLFIIIILWIMLQGVSLSTCDHVTIIKLTLCQLCECVIMLTRVISVILWACDQCDPVSVRSCEHVISAIVWACDQWDIVWAGDRVISAILWVCDQCDPVSVWSVRSCECGIVWLLKTSNQYYALTLCE